MTRLPCPARLWPEFSRQLDLALDRPKAEREAWLEGLAGEHRELLPYLRAVLAADDGSSDIAADALAALAAETASGQSPPGRAGVQDAAEGGREGDFAGDFGTGRENDDFQALAGDRVGPYTLERELGRGGMGVVWLAARSDGAYERKVALKLPHTHLSGSSMQRRFRTAAFGMRAVAVIRW